MSCTTVEACEATAHAPDLRQVTQHGNPHSDDLGHSSPWSREGRKQAHVAQQNNDQSADFSMTLNPNYIDFWKVGERTLQFLSS